MPHTPAPAEASSTPASLERLTRREYDNAVRDLLHDPNLSPSGDYDFAPEQPIDTGFKAPISVSLPVAKQLRDAAEGLAARANLPRVLPCRPAARDEHCAARFIAVFGRRAYRRPLDALEQAQLLAIYRNAHSEMGLVFDDAIRLVLQAILQAPDFLYKNRVDAATTHLDRYERAARLSFLLWGTIPDDALIAATDEGRLDTDEGFAAEAKRLLSDRKRVGATLAAFSTDWLHLDRFDTLEKDQRAYPKWGPSTRRAAQSELAAFVESVAFDEDARLSTLLGATFTFAPRELATIYGLKTTKDRTVEKLQLPPTERRGLLTQIAFLAGQGSSVGSHPTKRGVTIYRGLLCGTVPQPPPNTPPLDPPEPGLTTRQRFEDHLIFGKACQGCHLAVDPWGFPFENYKGIGDLRTTEEGKPIVTDATVTFPSGRTLTVKGAVDLIDALKNDADVRTCYARQWYRYALRRKELGRDASWFAAIASSFEKSEGDLRGLLLALVTSPAFKEALPQ